MSEPIPPFSSATATPHSLPPHWNNKIKPTLLPLPPPFSSDSKPMLGVSSNNRLSSPLRNVIVLAPNEPGRKIEIYSLLLHHHYASNSKVSSDHGRFAWFLARSFLISRRWSPIATIAVAMWLGFRLLTEIKLWQHRTEQNKIIKK